MIIRILTTGTNINVQPQVARVIKVYNYRVPSGITEDIFTEAGQLLSSDGDSSPAVVPAPTVEGQKLIARLGQTVKMAWETDSTDLTPVYIGLVPGGRLTLTSNTPVTTTDVTAAGTLYYAPFIHNKISLHDGSSWSIHTFTQRSLSLTLTSGNNYDVFIYDNSGTLTLELSNAWTNDTTRADAITQQDGIYVKAGDSTRRYLGTIRASGTNTTEDSTSKRYLWNMHNRVSRNMKAVDTTDTWNYTTATWRSTNSNTTDGAGRFSCVIGIVEDIIDITNIAICYNSSGGTYAACGIGLDSTSVNSANVFGGIATSGSYGGSQISAIYKGTLSSVGYHYIQRLEIAQAVGVTTWIGDFAVSYLQSGMVADILM